MKFTREQKRIAYKNLPSEVQNFIMDNETTGLVAGYLGELGLSEEQSNLADSEILYAMFGLQTLTEAIASIAKLIGKKEGDLYKLETDLGENIFSKIILEKTDMKNKEGWFDSLYVGRKEEIKSILKNLIKEKSFQKILSSIEEYAKYSPKELQKFVSDIVWLKRAGEISTKYSLTEEQTLTLQNLALFVIIGVEEPETFAESVEKELGISKLLTEQVVKDVDERVFQYAFNLLSESEKEIVVPEMSKVAFDTDEEIPEIRPEIVPMVERGEIARNAEKPEKVPFSVPDLRRAPSLAPENLPGVEIAENQNPVVQAEQNSQPTKIETFVGSDFIQKPNIPVENIQKPENPPIIPVTQPSPTQSSAQQTPPKPQTDVQYPPKYTVDPYREPIE